MSGQRLLAAAVLGAAFLGLTACSPVQPWQRGNLAKPQMALQPHPQEAAFREHVYGGREAGSGASASSGGGGCGCY